MNDAAFTHCRQWLIGGILSGVLIIAGCPAQDGMQNGNQNVNRAANENENENLNGVVNANGNTNVNGGMDANANQNVNDNTNLNGNQNDNVGDNGDLNVNDNVSVNFPPTAEAGADQTVDAGSTVELDGTGSSDPDGDNLSYSWLQTGGAGVTLINADTAMPSFTAPGVAAMLTFELTVDDGNGGIGSDTVIVIVTIGVPDQLFVVNFGGSVISFKNPACANGDIAPDTSVEGAQTQLTFATGVVVDAAGELIVSQEAGNPIAVFEDAVNATGNVTPVRTVAGAATMLSSARPMAYDAGADLLFVGDIATDKIHVFADVSTAAFDGDLAPVRLIESTGGNLGNPWSLDFDSSGNLYVANRIDNNVLVFSGAAGADGDVAPSQTINSNAFSATRGVFVDDDDHLYVADSTNDEIYIFDNASTISGTVAPDRTLTVPGAGDLWAVTVDAAGTGYILDSGGAIYIYEDIAAQSGSVDPDRTISGANTQLTMPVRMFHVAGSGNQPPSSDAGADQTVSVQGAVQLMGSGCDPDGDTLSYTWMQTSGEAVTLNSDSVADPVFTAPTQDTTLTFELTVGDGNGGSDSDTVTVTVNAISSQLYAVNFGGRVISYYNPHLVDGDAAPDTVLEGAQTELTLSTGVGVNAADELMVCQGDSTILVFADAATVGGDTPPLRKVEGASTLLAFPRPMAIDTGSDRLFVGDISTDKIHVYENVSDAAFDGDIAPARVIESSAGNLGNPWGLAWTAADDLYVVNRNGNNVLVFSSAGAADGDVNPTRTVDSASFTSLRGVYVDSGDALYVVDSTNNEVYRFNNASTVDGNVNPDATLTVSGAISLWAVVIDSNGTGYLLDNANSGAGSVYVYDNIATLDGTVSPQRTVTGSNTLLEDARRLFLLE